MLKKLLSSTNIFYTFPGKCVFYGVFRYVFIAFLQVIVHCLPIVPVLPVFFSNTDRVRDTDRLTAFGTERTPGGEIDLENGELLNAGS